MSSYDVQKAWIFSERVWPSKSVDQGHQNYKHAHGQKITNKEQWKKVLFYILILFSFKLELHFW